MSETWTPKTEQAETWTSLAPQRHLFSNSLFSHDFLGLDRVFSLTSPDGSAEVWDNVTAQSETWTPA